MKEAKFIKQFEIFLIKAKQDLMLVEQVINNISVADEIKYFHLQQCVEKAIKSLLSSRGVSFPKTHDLEDLVELAEDNDIKLPEYIKILTTLNAYAVESRYAIILEHLYNVGTYLFHANIFIEFIEALLKESR
ncbi:HEPN domain-containing protein [Candidatus Magnetobacterium casense]|uniref:HEPN domain-containing protein n=1 Tax=Candidatus Magnetobacterium casense TaxID=1455061 RepID=A0ABS6RWR0_9BACT|nr:HEPN domain-containing protein [Candidatus Magnetobacterium casensis]MBV6341074.1 HEPN domain-containing protein [Candidatus Magnetobacterium casensis]